MIDKITSGSYLGGTGGGVTDIRFLATGGGAINGGVVGGSGGKTATPKPNGRCPLKPATCGSGVSPGVSGLSSGKFSSYINS